jgi:hypothetical protein
MWMYRNSFTYKMPSGAPHKFGEEKQRKFIEYHSKMKGEAG